MKLSDDDFDYFSSLEDEHDSNTFEDKTKPYQFEPVKKSFLTAAEESTFASDLDLDW